jgi:hypothetical protein
MPSIQQWLYTDVVSGESVTTTNAGIPDRWALVGSDYHGPLGLYVIAQRLITQVIPGNASYDQVITTPYDPESVLDSSYALPSPVEDPPPAE